MFFAASTGWESTLVAAAVATMQRVSRQQTCNLQQYPSKNYNHSFFS